jgi:flagellar basal body rod protein FlgG
MAGVGRTAFKATRPILGGLAGPIRAVGGGQAGAALSVPEASLTLGTGIDFAQGPLQPSGSPLHLALDGPGFFPVVPGHAEGPLCFTRDGEFRLVPDPRGGYCLMNGLGMRLFIPPPRSVLARVTSPDPQQFDPCRLFNGVSTEPLQIACFAKPEQSLRYACYGATVFVPAQAAEAPRYHALAAAAGLRFDGLATVLRPQALEGSNADVGRLIPDLSLAQKLFSALAQLIAAENRRFDTMFDVLK